MPDFAEYGNSHQEGSGKEQGDSQKRCSRCLLHLPSVPGLPRAEGFPCVCRTRSERLCWAKPDGAWAWGQGSRAGFSALLTHVPLLPNRYLGKEGWAPASYLKKAKEDLPARKKNLAGPVEIIGNIMEISNLLNKKASGDKETPPAEGEGPEAPIAKKEISLPILCNASNGSALAVPERTVSKLAQSSPAVARIAPQRAQISKSLTKPWGLAAKIFIEWAWGARKARKACRTPTSFSS